MAGRLT